MHLTYPKFDVSNELTNYPVEHKSPDVALKYQGCQFLVYII